MKRKKFHHERKKAKGTGNEASQQRKGQKPLSNVLAICGICALLIRCPFERGENCEGGERAPAGSAGDAKQDDFRQVGRAGHAECYPLQGALVNSVFGIRYQKPCTMVVERRHRAPISSFSRPHRNLIPRSGRGNGGRKGWGGAAARRIVERENIYEGRKRAKNIPGASEMEERRNKIKISLRSCVKSSKIRNEKLPSLII